MIFAIYRKAFAVLREKPWRLWGISLLAVFLRLLADAGFAGILAVGFGVTLLLNASMARIYLRGCHGEAVECAQLFEGFRKENIARVTGGMAWRWLWLALWVAVPAAFAVVAAVWRGFQTWVYWSHSGYYSHGVAPNLLLVLCLVACAAGVVMAVIKRYAYALTPYILMTRPEVNATQAIKISEKETVGYRGKMFLADLLAYMGAGVLVLLFALISQIPVIGFVGMILIIATVVLLPLFLGLIHAAFYDEIQKCAADPAYRAQYFPVPPVGPAGPAAVQEDSGAPQAPANFCPNCGTKLSGNSAFCPNCGTKVN